MPTPLVMPALGPAPSIRMLTRLVFGITGHLESLQVEGGLEASRDYSRRRRRKPVAVGHPD